MRKIFYLIAILIIVGTIYLESKNNTKTGQSYEFPNVEINGSFVKIEVADTIQKQIQGLSDKEKLEKDEGMFFVFDDKQVRSFWMKKMNFPLDIIWIEDNKIVNISKNLAPEGESPVNKYSSIQRVNHVLEVNAGFSDSKNLKIGDMIKINRLEN